MTAAERLAETIKAAGPAERVRILRETAELVREFLEEMEWRALVCRDIDDDLTPLELPDDWQQGAVQGAVERLGRGLAAGVNESHELEDLLACADIPDVLDDDALADVERRLAAGDASRPTSGATNEVRP